jgi:hypothetical protein
MVSVASPFHSSNAEPFSRTDTTTFTSTDIGEVT